MFATKVVCSGKTWFPVTTFYLMVVAPNKHISQFFIYLSFFILFIYIYCWDPLRLRLEWNSHYDAWSYEKKKYKMIKGYRKVVQKEFTNKICLLILDLNIVDLHLRSKYSVGFRGKYSIGAKFQGLAMPGNKLTCS